MSIRSSNLRYSNARLEDWGWLPAIRPVLGSLYYNLFFDRVRNSYIIFMVIQFL